MIQLTTIELLTLLVALPICVALISWVIMRRKMVKQHLPLKRGKATRIHCRICGFCYSNEGSMISSCTQCGSLNENRETRTI